MDFYLGASGVLSTTTFVLYLKYMLVHGFKNKQYLTNYEFRYQIAMGWLNQNKYSKKFKYNHTKNILDSHRIAPDSPSQRLVKS